MNAPFRLTPPTHPGHRPPVREALFSHCGLCGRALSDRPSQVLGFGIGCAAVLDVAHNLGASWMGARGTNANRSDFEGRLTKD